MKTPTDYEMKRLWDAYKRNNMEEAVELLHFILKTSTLNNKSTLDAVIDMKKSISFFVEALSLLEYKIKN